MDTTKSEENIFEESTREETVREETLLRNSKIKEKATAGLSFFEKMGYTPRESKPSFIERNVHSPKARIAIYIAVIILAIFAGVFKFAIMPRLGW